MKKYGNAGNRRLWMLGAALMAGLLVSLAAWAVPYPAYGYVTVVTYYSTAAKTQVVGVRNYGNCPPGSYAPLDYGSTSAHQSVEIGPWCGPRPDPWPPLEW